MVEVAILLISVSIFLEFVGLAYVVYTLWSNQRKNAKCLKDMNARFEQLNAEIYEDVLKAHQQASSAAVPVAFNFWSTRGAKN